MKSFTIWTARVVLERVREQQRLYFSSCPSPSDVLDACAQSFGAESITNEDKRRVLAGCYGTNTASLYECPSRAVSACADTRGEKTDLMGVYLAAVAERLQTKIMGAVEEVRKEGAPAKP